MFHSELSQRPEKTTRMAPPENPPTPGSLTIPMPYEKPNPDYNDWVWSWPEICRGDLCKKVMVMMML